MGKHIGPRSGYEQAQAKRLMHRLEGVTIRREALDDMVHGAASRIASRTCNSSEEDQFYFLLQQGYTVEGILEELGIE